MESRKGKTQIGQYLLAMNFDCYNYRPLKCSFGSFHIYKIAVGAYLINEQEGEIQPSKVTSICPLSKGCNMSVLVGTGDNVWSGLYVISSTVGLVILVSLMDFYYINPFNIKKWWYKGLLFFLCMVASVVLFGGLVVCLWSLWEEHISSKRTTHNNVNDIEKVGEDIPKDTLAQKDLNPKAFANSTTIEYGTRPNFDGMFFYNLSICHSCQCV